MKYILLSIILIISISCKTAEQHDLPCGTICEQAQNLVKKLIDNPGDIIEILEDEKCVDCTKMLNYLKEKERRIDVFEALLQEHNDWDCTLSDCSYLIFSGKDAISLGIANCPNYVEPEHSDDVFPFLQFYFIKLDSNRVSFERFSRDR